MILQCQAGDCSNEAYSGWPACGLCSEHVTSRDEFVQANPEIAHELNNLVAVRKRLATLYSQALRRWEKDHEIDR